MTDPQPTGPFHLPVHPQWLQQWREDIVEPDLPIIDPHHHLWDRPGWRYLLPDLLADTGDGHDVRASVYVQARAMHRADGPERFRPVGETEFANGIAAMSASGGYGPARICAGIVGHADLTLGAAVQDVLEMHIRAGMGRFKGVRYSTARDDDLSLVNPGYHPPPGLLADRVFREGFARLAGLGLSFDSWVYHPQLSEVAELAAAFPDTTIILNHFGGPLRAGAYAGRDAEVFSQWSQMIPRLAACPNVFVKLGGLGMRTSGARFHAAAMPPGSDVLAAAWRPFVETCIGAFGSTRCMFESNFPVDKGSYSYHVFWNACKRLASGAGADEKAALFHGTAARAYRVALPPRPSAGTIPQPT